MVGGTLGIVHRSASHKSSAEVRPFAAVLPDDLLIDPIGKDETFGDNPQVLQDFLHAVWNSDNIDVILLQTHFFTHEQLDMDLVIFLK
ncbi:hypothetical protein D3C74_326330 [compost metagenome]